MNVSYEKSIPGQVKSCLGSMRMIRMQEMLMKIQDVTKTFSGVVALNHVNLEILKGEVHALVGENGAGKSTLMNIMSGVYSATEGTLEWEGKEISFHNTRDSQNIGIAMIHQELSLAQHLSVMENIFMGRLPLNAHHQIDRRKLEKDSRELLKQVGLSPDFATEKVAKLSVSQQQMVEIAKALSWNAKLVIMDEPTACLTASETQILLQIIRKLKQQNISVIYISHRIEEVFAIADRITVLRDGVTISTDDNADIDEMTVLSRMVGRAYESAHRRTSYRVNGSKPVLEVKGLSYKNRVSNVSFDLYPKEVLVITGLVGAGRSELVESIVGARRCTGDIRIQGHPVKKHTVNGMMHEGVMLVPEGRKIQGILPQLSISDNLSVSALGHFCSGGVIRKRKLNAAVQQKISELRIKTPSAKQAIKYLSGGNQQKVIIGRCILANPRVLILDEPTNGIDVGAKQEIYNQIDALAKEGMSIICISSEMAEVMKIADRVLVMHEGKVTGILDNNEELDQNRIMQYATSYIAEGV